jgi:carbamate kinase
MKHRTVVVAFGGNALLRAGDDGTDAEQARNASAASRPLADLVRRRLDLIVVHGNGPQVGNLLIQMEEAALKVPPSTLDVAVAMSQGSIGYFIERALRSEFERRRIARPVATLMTEVLVREDPESLQPTKPVGPFLTKHRALELKRRLAVAVVEDAGRGWRRVVASPRPVEVLNLEAIRALLAAGHVVIAGGGGGVPLCRGKGGRLRGVEAVIDKDHTASLLARALGPALFVLLTGVPQVSLDFGTADESPLGEVKAAELERHLDAGHFAPGSMRPKVEAVLEFLAAGGREAIITDARSLGEAMRGRAGTRVYRDRFV